MGTSYRHLSQRVRDVLVSARLDQKITQDDLAKRLGRRQNYISNYERGERRLDIFELIELADALHIEPNELTNKLVEIWQANKKN